jgi:glycogen(starch) synthase
VIVPVPHRPTPQQIADAYRAHLGPLLAERWAGVDVVHAHTTYPLGWSVATSLPADTRLVITEHSSKLSFYFDDALMRDRYREAAARAAAVITVSRQMADEIAGVLPATLHDRLHALANPISFERLPLRPDPPQALTRWVYLGNLIPTKGVFLVLQAFALAVERAEDTELRLTFVGDGAAGKELVAEARRLGLADRVTVRPGVAPEAVWQTLADHDVLVHLSDAETFGRSVLEAAATGLPVVVTRCGGPEETLAAAADLGGVVFVPPEPQPEDVVEALTRLQLRARSADWAGIRRLLEFRFSLPAVGARIAGTLFPDLATPARSGARGAALLITDAGARRDLIPIVETIRTVTGDLSVQAVLTSDWNRRERRAPAAALLDTPPLTVRLADRLGGMRSRIPVAVGRELIRQWVRRRSRNVAQAVAGSTRIRDARLVIADPFMSTATMSLQTRLPIVSMEDRRRMWQLLASFLDDPARDEEGSGV